MLLSQEKVIQKLELQPHPEGGFFKEIYRSDTFINSEHLPKQFEGPRNYATAIYFMLTSDNFSAFHKINQDEIWHYYYGATIRLHIISPKGAYSQQLLGLNFEADEMPQIVIKAQNWFAAEVVSSNTFSLVGCTVTPGFDFKDFVLAERKELTNLFPQHAEVINRFTREK